MIDSLICKVRQGKLLYNKELLAKYLEKYEGKKLFLNLQLHEESKTASQRGYYFAAVVRDAAEFFGWETSDMHDWLKSECNKKELVNPITGEICLIAGSTAPLKKGEMAAYIDRAIRKLAQMGYVVHTPEEYFAEIGYREEPH
jgi:hypothetical protein